MGPIQWRQPYVKKITLQLSNQPAIFELTAGKTVSPTKMSCLTSRVAGSFKRTFTPWICFRYIRTANESSAAKWQTWRPQEKNTPPTSLLHGYKSTVQSHYPCYAASFELSSLASAVRVTSKNVLWPWSMQFCRVGNSWSIIKTAFRIS